MATLLHLIVCPKYILSPRVLDCCRELDTSILLPKPFYGMIMMQKNIITYDNGKPCAFGKNYRDLLSFGLFLELLHKQGETILNLLDLFPLTYLFNSIFSILRNWDGMIAVRSISCAFEGPL